MVLDLMSNDKFGCAEDISHFLNVLIGGDFTAYVVADLFGRGDEFGGKGPVAFLIFGMRRGHDGRGGSTTRQVFEYSATEREYLPSFVALTEGETGRFPA